MSNSYDRAVIETKIHDMQIKYRIPSIQVAYIDKAKEVLNICSGYADKENMLLTDSNTRYQVGSISKSLTAWGILRLVERNILDLDAPVDIYLKKWKLPKSKYNNKITIRNILSHTAGLNVPFYVGSNKSIDGYSIIHSLSGNIKAINKVKVLYEPNHRFRYSGGGYSILQYVIEEVTNLKFASYMDQYILQPLKMYRSTFTQENSIEFLRALSYSCYGKKFADHQFVEQAAAGLYSTASDLSKFMIANMCYSNQYNTGDCILKPDSVQLMHKRIRREIPYGLGFSIATIGNKRIVYHKGINLGWFSLLCMIPSEDSGIVVLTNGGQGENFVYDVLKMWFDNIVGMTKISKLEYIEIRKKSKFRISLEEFLFYLNGL